LCLECERFEKLGLFTILGLQRNYLKGVKRSAAAKQPFTGSRTTGEVSEGSGFVSEPPHNPRLRVYGVSLRMIFILLAMLKAACWNQPLNWHLMMMVNPARLARS
jgi:hypothetical protein